MCFHLAQALHGRVPSQPSQGTSADNTIQICDHEWLSRRIVRKDRMSSRIVRRFQASKFDIKVFLLHSMGILACALNVGTCVEAEDYWFMYVFIFVLFYWNLQPGNSLHNASKNPRASSNIAQQCTLLFERHGRNSTLKFLQNLKAVQLWTIFDNGKRRCKLYRRKSEQL